MRITCGIWLKRKSVLTRFFPSQKQENDEIDQLLGNLDRWDKLADQAYSVIVSDAHIVRDFLRQYV